MLGKDLASCYFSTFGKERSVDEADGETQIPSIPVVRGEVLKVLACGAVLKDVLYSTDKCEKLKMH